MSNRDRDLFNTGGPVHYYFSGEKREGLPYKGRLYDEKDNLVFEGFPLKQRGKWFPSTPHVTCLYGSRIVDSPEIEGAIKYSNGNWFQGEFAYDMDADEEPIENNYRGVQIDRYGYVHHVGLKVAGRNTSYGPRVGKQVDHWPKFEKCMEAYYVQRE